MSDHYCVIVFDKDGTIAEVIGPFSSRTWARDYNDAEHDNEGAVVKFVPPVTR